MNKLCREGKIYYETAGVSGGTPIIFLHGWGGSVASFKGVYNNLSKDYYVINLDFYGFGNSDVPSRALSVSDYADSVRELIGYLGIDRTHIVAHSFGGRVAIKLAAEYPDIIDKIILVDSAGIKPRRGLKVYLRILRYKLLRALSKVFGKIDLTKYGSADYRALPEAMKGTFVRVVNEDLTPLLKKITASVLIVWGEDDKDTPLYMAKKLHARIANSGLVVLKGAGHYSYIDKYAQFLAVADRFLRG